jgi:hypothetical protein
MAFDRRRSEELSKKKKREEFEVLIVFFFSCLVNQGKLSPEDLRTFQAETQLMMNLRPHRNVVQLRGVCQVSSSFANTFFVGLICPPM